MLINFEKLIRTGKWSPEAFENFETPCREIVGEQRNLAKSREDSDYTNGSTLNNRCPLNLDI
jgi:hypothetical protein